MLKLRKATIILSVINSSAGSVLILIFLLVFTLLYLERHLSDITILKREIRYGKGLG